LIVTSPKGASAVQSRSLKGRAKPVTAKLLVKAVPPADGGAVVTLGDASVNRTDAVMISRGKATLVSGLLGQQCMPPDSSWWFVGAESQYGRNDIIVLTNPTNSSALVDIDSLTNRGTLHSADSRGIAVPAHSRRALSVARLFPGVSACALHITTTNGVVHASVLASEFTGTSGSGAEWLPATTPGAQVVPLAPDLGAARLFIAAPTSASVSVRAIGPGGAFTPVGLSGLSVAAGAVLAVPIPAVAPDAAALVVTSSRPVAVAVVGKTARTSGGRGDLVATAGVLPKVKSGQAFTSVSGLSARLIVVGDAQQRTSIRITTATAQGPWVRNLALAPGDARTLALPVTASRMPVQMLATRGSFSTVLSLRASKKTAASAADITLAARATTVLVRPAAQLPR
jgi:hypothetical protein